jgi:hypothetical protein
VNQNWKHPNNQTVAYINSYSTKTNICQGCTVTSTASREIKALVIVCWNAHKSFKVVFKSGNHSFTVHKSVTLINGFHLGHSCSFNICLQVKQPFVSN